ncbi:hypothetical protein GCM10009504_04160 [Pseudomonas laurentiana]|uniref:DUF2790 domain-containing protein n=1 Tax=Pseudomonas laurentiana TaxID=2364649 RepID=A0A6I5RN66_9PSED|nr:DUF2790 domain-containing protein [Pseudomonas laurentiana]NES09407.1 DUF2790 domain-containing protein [Pseudomonas laurentiana]GGU50837.1 hypothetical protein GCM10009504_04160 [Pseudomonas laurentiana]
MKSRWVFASALLACAAVQAQDAVPLYHYGMPLDVANVVNLSEPESMLCEVVQARMVYKDSTGQVRSLDYLKLAQVCSNGG